MSWMAARSSAILSSGSESQTAPDCYVSRLSPLLFQSISAKSSLNLIGLLWRLNEKYKDFSIEPGIYYLPNKWNGRGLPWWLCSKAYSCNAGDHLQCRRRGFDLWVRKIPWRRKWELTLVFLPGKFHGQRSLAVYCPWHLKTWTWLSN